MTALTAFYPAVIPYCPGVPEPFVDQKALEVVRDFCWRTCALREDVDPIDVVADTFLYTLTPVTANREVLGIVSARFNDEPLYPVNIDRMAVQYPDAIARIEFTIGANLPNDSLPSNSWEALEQTQPQWYYQPRPDQIRLIGIPDTAYTDGLDVNIAVRPTLTATEVDDWLFARYRDQLAKGVIARLLEMPKKDWTDYKAAGYYGSLYNESVEKALAEVLRNFARNDQNISRSTAIV